MFESEPEIRRLLAVAREGSPEAMGQALEGCRAYLLLIAQQEMDPNLKAKGGASDLVQQTFLEAQKDFARFSGENRTELRAWLRRLLLNNIANFARHYRGTEKRSLEREASPKAGESGKNWFDRMADSTLTPSSYFVRTEQSELLERAMGRLPEDYREVLRLRYLEELSYDEIGQRMKRSANAVQKLWMRAIERLQEEMSERDE